MSTLVALSVALAIAFYSSGTNGQFINGYDQPFLHACNGNQVLKSVYSVHSNGAEDRRWRFTCAAAPNGASPSNCYWTDYVNTWDQPISFMCNSDYVISGLQSYHSNGAEDRRFKFKCCKHEGYKAYSCSITSYLNSWDRVLNYNVPNGRVIVGTASEHSNGAEDRRYKFISCQYGRLVPPS
ncbi:hemagglutinin/amebocyte aggregation factor [Plakobranchus ocellatus]|uniref:Hemagglutinin/amebocyte aggregation factor n=1 Tax=Plakobranchus ocellatus TaxID=259542 RepID=A0AAV4ADG3_9GAST|nr:hemagglutinin/amebocyte aggregation factor [Plakobranchus ocellatus]